MSENPAATSTETTGDAPKQDAPVNVAAMREYLANKHKPTEQKTTTEAAPETVEQTEQVDAQKSDETTADGDKKSRTAKRLENKNKKIHEQDALITELTERQKQYRAESETYKTIALTLKERLDRMEKTLKENGLTVDDRDKKIDEIDLRDRVTKANQKAQEDFDKTDRVSIEQRRQASIIVATAKEAIFNHPAADQLSSDADIARVIRTKATMNELKGQDVPWEDVVDFVAQQKGLTTRAANKKPAPPVTPKPSPPKVVSHSAPPAEKKYPATKEGMLQYLQDKKGSKP